MRQLVYIRRTSRVFSRWSRKNWAVFAAIGKQVNIGHVSVDICNKSYSKSSTTGKAVALQYVSPEQHAASSEYGLENDTYHLELVDVACFHILSRARQLFEEIKNYVSYKDKGVALDRCCAFVFSPPTKQWISNKLLN